MVTIFNFYSLANYTKFQVMFQILYKTKLQEIKLRDQGLNRYETHLLIYIYY